MGSPQQPTASQLSALKRSAQLKLLTSPEWRRTEAGKLELKFPLPRQAVSLVTLAVVSLARPNPPLAKGGKCWRKHSLIPPLQRGGPTPKGRGVGGWTRRDEPALVRARYSPAQGAPW